MFPDGTLQVYQAKEIYLEGGSHFSTLLGSLMREFSLNFSLALTSLWRMYELDDSEFGRETRYVGSAPQALSLRDPPQDMHI